MLRNLAAKTTDPIRRQALGLAIQLPPDIAEARAVLDQTRQLLEEYMINPRRKTRKGRLPRGGDFPTANRKRGG